MIGRTLSHYRIIEKLGEGGMGVVYAAEDTVLGRRVAIKMLTAARGPVNQHFRMRFLREAQAVSKLSHPHIANVYDYGESENGEPYIVMELVPGETLADLINANALSIPRALEIIGQVAEALDEAHRHGIVHRDIKPSNIAINERGKVKVLDFGLAKSIVSAPTDSPDPSAKTQTREGVIVGTPMYLSPEQALGVEVDPRSDLFSLGSVLYECIAGQPAFPGKSDIEICAKVIRDDPPPPSTLNSNVSGELDRLTLKALAKKPEARYQTSDELSGDLTRIEATAAGLNQAAPRTSRGGRGTQRSGVQKLMSDIFRRPRLSIAYVFGALLVISIVGTLAWRWPWKTSYKPSTAAQRLYDHAVEKMHEGAFFRASKMLEQVIQDNDPFALAHARLAEAYAELDYSEKAKEQLLRAQELVPDPSVLPEVEGQRFRAVTDVVKRDFRKAVVDYQDLVVMTPADEKHHALVDLGRALEKNDQLDKAIETYEQAKDLNRRSAAAFLRLGVTYGRSLIVDRALASFEQASSLFETTAEVEGLAEVSLQRGVLLTQVGSLKDAHDELIKALAKSTALENQDKRIRVMLNLSNNLIHDRRPAEAQQYSTEALSLASENKMENLTIQGIIEIGNAYFLKGDYTAAEKNFNEALRLAQLYKAGRGEARAFLMLASLRNHQNDPFAARDFVLKAMPFFQQGSYRKEVGQAYSMLGHAQDQSGDYDSAFRTFQQQLDLAQQAGDRQQMAISREGLGVVLNHRQNYPAARDQFSQQYDLAKSRGADLVRGYSAMNVGTMLWQLGDYAAADQTLNEALAIAEKGGDPLKELVAWIRISRARMALSRGDIGKATSDSLEALKTAGPEMKAITIQAKWTLGLAETTSGKTALGKRHCQEAVDLAKTLGDPLPLSQALLALSQAALAAGDRRTALESAQQSQQRFALANQYESEWRAWMVIAQASASSDARRASETLSRLEKDWPAGDYQAYLTRPDVIELRQHLAKMLQAR